jgi:hypothetical protein
MVSGSSARSVILEPTTRSSDPKLVHEHYASDWDINPEIGRAVYAEHQAPSPPGARHLQAKDCHGVDRLR